MASWNKCSVWWLNAMLAKHEYRSTNLLDILLHYPSMSANLPQSHRRASPSQLRRRAKRAQAFAAASAATETAEAAVETSTGEDEIKVAEVVAPQPSHGPQDEVQPLQKRQADQACQVLPPHADQAEQAQSALQCYQVNQAQHEADAAVQARQVLPPMQIKLNKLSLSFIVNK